MELGHVAAEDVAFERHGHVSEVRGTAPGGGVVVLRGGAAVFPKDAAVLPHRPLVPDAVEAHEAVRGERIVAAQGALGAGRVVEGDPVGGAADDGLLGRGGGTEAIAERDGVFEVNDGRDAGEGFDALDEIDEAVRGGRGVEVADEQDFPAGEASGGGDRADAADEILRLERGGLVHGDEVVGAEKEAGAIGGGEEVGELRVEQRALGGASDQALGSVGAEGGDVVLRVGPAAAVVFLRVPAGDVDDGGRGGNRGAAETAGAAVAKQRDEEEREKAEHEEGERARKGEARVEEMVDPSKILN